MLKFILDFFFSYVLCCHFFWFSSITLFGVLGSDVNGRSLRYILKSDIQVLLLVMLIFLGRSTLDSSRSYIVQRDHNMRSTTNTHTKYMYFFFIFSQCTSMSFSPPGNAKLQHEPFPGDMVRSGEVFYGHRIGYPLCHHPLHRHA